MVELVQLGVLGLLLGPDTTDNEPVYPAFQDICESRTLALGKRRRCGPRASHTGQMDAALAGLIGTGIGAIAGFVGSAMTARHQSQVERERIRAARVDELTRAERRAVQDLVKLIATGTQHISWLA